MDCVYPVVLLLVVLDQVVLLREVLVQVVLLQEVLRLGVLVLSVPDLVVLSPTRLRCDPAGDDPEAGH